MFFGHLELHIAADDEIDRWPFKLGGIFLSCLSDDLREVSFGFHPLDLKVCVKNGETFWLGLLRSRTFKDLVGTYCERKGGQEKAARAASSLMLW